MGSFARDGRGSAVRWFALASAVLSMAGMAGAHTLDWLSQSGRVALLAYRAPAAEAGAKTDSGVDTMPTGSIPPNALVIRIR